MWVQDEDIVDAESDATSDLSSEDDRDIQCEILEMQRDEANQRLSELQEVSSQLLKEVNVLEIQFQIERSCRESAEALAVKMSKDNKALKRTSQMLLPFIPELPDWEAEVDNCDTVDSGEESSDDTLLLESQAKITELQTSVDSLLAEKLQLEQQVEDLTKEQIQLREQLVLEVEEKEAILRKINKQNKNMNKMKRVSQLVTEEFTEMSQELKLEKGLRQHAEVVAHQLMQKVAEGQRAEIRLQLQQALEQISTVSMALCDIRRHYHEVKQNESTTEEGGILPELQALKDQLETSEKQKKVLEMQLSEANVTVTQLQVEVKQLQDRLKEDNNHEPEIKATPAPPPPPPPPPPPLPPPPTTITNSPHFLRSRARKADQNGESLKESTPLPGMKANAVEEMMERIKKGIILRPISRIQDNQDDNSSWTDMKSDNRKSAILELKGMLDKVKHQSHRRVLSRRGIGRNVAEAELMEVLQRRRKAIGVSVSELEVDSQNDSERQADPSSDLEFVPAAGSSCVSETGGGSPVLRRLKQNREKRDSRLRASALLISQAN